MSAIAELVREHREIDGPLDLLDESLAAGSIHLPSFRRVTVLAAQHYGREAAFLGALSRNQPAVAAKLASQHAEALEIAAHVEDSLAANQAVDAFHLARRFVAIVRHNMIEEERDVFPLA
jgi:hypothetical protein